jgi:hypothetical protein
MEKVRREPETIFGGSSLENRSVDQVAINRFSGDDDG